MGVGEGAFKSWWLWRFKTLNGAGSPELLVDGLIGAVDAVHVLAGREVIKLCVLANPEE